MHRENSYGVKKLSPVDRDTLLAPLEEGGKNMFDIEARNEAIHIMTLKSYLEMESMCCLDILCGQATHQI